MALVGVLRPRLLIARGVLQALSGEELSASVAHEIGHQRAWDNLKRLAMRAAPDLMTTTSAARAIERRWASASERVADRQACRSGRARCALASALVKVARLMPSVTPIAEPISTLVDGGEIASRVHSLLEDAPDAEAQRASWHWAALALAFPIAALVYAPLLRGVHALTELIVNSL
jgi:Zn-dependent protease with chaperone function